MTHKTIPARPPRDGRAFIRVVALEDFGPVDPDFRETFMRQWPEGIRYDVLAWDGGCDDRATVLCAFADLKDAQEYRRQRNAAVRR
jgi:hypothetical protein